MRAQTQYASLPGKDEIRGYIKPLFPVDYLCTQLAMSLIMLDGFKVVYWIYAYAYIQRNIFFRSVFWLVYNKVFISNYKSLPTSLIT